MKNMKVSALALCSLAAWSSGSFNPVQANTEDDTLDALPDQFDAWSDADAGLPLVTIETVSSEWENTIAVDPLTTSPLASNQGVIQWSSDLESPEFVNTVISPAESLETTDPIERTDSLETTQLIEGSITTKLIDTEYSEPEHVDPEHVRTEHTKSEYVEPKQTESEHVEPEQIDTNILSSPDLIETVATGYLLMEPLEANIPDTPLLSTDPATDPATGPLEEKSASEASRPEANPLAQSVLESSALESSALEASSIEPSVVTDEAITTTTATDAVAYAYPFPATGTPETNLLATNIVASSIPTLGIPEARFNLAQLPLEPPILEPVNEAEVEQLINEIDQIGADTSTPYRSSPAITISNPSGFGADNFTGFVGVGYQERTRFANEDDGGLVVGMGFGDARENVGVQLSYTIASFGGSRDFGTGGFNAKIHRRLSDEWSVAVGWEGFATTGFVDFEDSIYGSASHLIRTRDSITKPFSRIALTAGAGSGRFRTEDAVFEDRDDIGVFGSMSVRVVEPVSAIVEWTGQDLAAGLSITPFKKIPLVLVPAVRDITGAGDGARFVMGAGFSFQL